MCKFRINFKKFFYKKISIFVFFFFRLWIKKVKGLENIPENGPGLIISNHLSYYDFLLLGSLLKQELVFVAKRKIKETFFIRWFTNFHSVVYLDKENPGVAFFKNLIHYLQEGKFLVIYPEGTRSRNKKMLLPRPGFVKLAIKANAPIIPLAMKGTYEILPPQRHIPSFRRCEIIVNRKIYISPNNPLFSDIFFGEKRKDKFKNLPDEALRKIAIRIMEIIRKEADYDWQPEIKEKVSKALRVKFKPPGVFDQLLLMAKLFLKSIVVCAS